MRQPLRGGDAISTIKIDAKKCKGCGYCVRFCPKNLIYLDTVFNEKGYHPAVFGHEDNCTGCGLCGLVCPDLAIVVYKEKDKNDSLPQRKTRCKVPDLRHC